jgi:hypothetical protein
LTFSDDAKLCKSKKMLWNIPRFFVSILKFSASSTILYYAAQIKRKFSIETSFKAQIFNQSENGKRFGLNKTFNSLFSGKSCIFASIFNIQKNEQSRDSHR